MKAAVTPPASREVLLCPGPVMLSPGVKAALAQSEIGHRDRRFAELVVRLRRHSAMVLGASDLHSVLFLTGSATIGLEAACATLFSCCAAVIVPVNGTFGARLTDILCAQGIRCVPVDFGFGMPFELTRIETALSEHATQGSLAVAMTHHETSVGILNPVADVCAMARRHGVRTLVDATSSAGAEDLDVTRDGIDACVTASGKCLHAPPGIAIVCVRRDLLERTRRERPRSYSLDLHRYHERIETNSQTPFTPAVPLFVALDRAIEELLAQGGVAERRRVYLRRRALLAAGLRRLGLSLLQLPAGSEASSILTVEVPAALGFDALYRAVSERGYVIYGAKPPLADRYFQLSVMGELGDTDLIGFLEVLESLLSGPASLYRAATA